MGGDQLRRAVLEVTSLTVTLTGGEGAEGEGKGEGEGEFKSKPYTAQSRHSLIRKVWDHCLQIVKFSD